MQYEITMIIAEMISSIIGINGLISKSDTSLSLSIKNTAGNANPRKSDKNANILDFIYPNLKKTGACIATTIDQSNALSESMRSISPFRIIGD